MSPEAFSLLVKIKVSVVPAINQKIPFNKRFSKSQWWKGKLLLEIIIFSFFGFPGSSYADGLIPEPVTEKEFLSGSQLLQPNRYPLVSNDIEGGSLAVWSARPGIDIQGQRVDSTGFPLGTSFQVNSLTTGNQIDPIVASRSNGDYLVVWQSIQDETMSTFSGQYISSNGSHLGSEFQIKNWLDERARSLVNRSFTIDDSGAFVILWREKIAEDRPMEVFGQRFDEEGNPVGLDFQVSSFNAAGRSDPSLAMSPNGDFAVVWVNNGDTEGSTYVAGQFYFSDGSKNGEELRLGEDSPQTKFQTQIVRNLDGSHVVFWRNGSGRIDLQAFSVDGSKLGNELYFSHNRGIKIYDAIAGLNNEILLFYAEGNVRIYGIRLDSNGRPLTQPFILFHRTEYPPYTNEYIGGIDAYFNKDGGFVLLWNDYYTPSNLPGPASFRVFSQQFGAPSATATPSPTPRYEPSLCSRTSGCFQWDLVDATYSEFSQGLNLEWRFRSSCQEPVERIDFRMLPNADIQRLEGGELEDGALYRTTGDHFYRVDVVGDPHPGVAFLPAEEDAFPLAPGEDDEFGFRVAVNGTEPFDLDSIFWNRASAGGSEGQMDIRASLCLEPGLIPAQKDSEVFTLQSKQRIVLWFALLFLALLWALRTSRIKTRVMR